MLPYVRKCHYIVRPGAHIWHAFWIGNEVFLEPNVMNYIETKACKDEVVEHCCVFRIKLPLVTRQYVDIPNTTCQADASRVYEKEKNEEQESRIWMFKELIQGKAHRFKFIRSGNSMFPWNITMLPDRQIRVRIKRLYFIIFKRLCVPVGMKKILNFHQLIGCYELEGKVICVAKL